MEKKYRLCKIALAVLLAALLLGGVVLHFVICEFADSGIHVLGRFAHIDTKQTCYFVTRDRQIVGQSVFAISGYLYDEPGDGMGSFDGYANLEKYPLTYGQLSFMGSIDPGVIRIDNDAAEQFEPQCDTFYYISILRGKDPIIAVSVRQNGEEVAFAICGATEAEVLTKLDQYLAFD